MGSWGIGEMGSRKIGKYECCIFLFYTFLVHQRGCILYLNNFPIKSKKNTYPLPGFSFEIIIGNIFIYLTRINRIYTKQLFQCYNLLKLNKPIYMRKKSVRHFIF